MNYNVRINDNFLRGDHVDGEVLQHTDLNELENVAKTAINANYEDIQKLQDGTTVVKNSEQLDGASLSKFATETLQNSDTKVPTSSQVKQYVDGALSNIDLTGYYTKREIDGIVETYDSDGNGIVDNAENAQKVNNHTVLKDVPADAKFTDTVYDDTEIRNELALKALKAETITALNGTQASPIDVSNLNAGLYLINGYMSVDGEPMEVNNDLTGVYQPENSNNKLIYDYTFGYIYEIDNHGEFINFSSFPDSLIIYGFSEYFKVVTDALINLNTADTGAYCINDSALIGTEYFSFSNVVMVSEWSNNKRTIMTLYDGNTITVTRTSSGGGYTYAITGTGNIYQTEDLTDYVKNTDYATPSKAGVIKSGFGLNVEGGTGYNAGKTYALKYDYASYGNQSDVTFISKGTLENVITGKGLVNNTNYATGSVAGVIKPSASFGTDVNASGVLFSSVVSSSNYSSLSNYAFISKGTLENVLTATVGDINSVLDAINGEVI